MVRMQRKQGTDRQSSSTALGGRALRRLNLVPLVVVGLITIACSSDNSGGTGPANVGGGTSSNTGGASGSTGGASTQTTGGASAASTGGQGSSTGGASAVGGSSASPTGGAATTGGASSSSTGGAATGGKSSSSAGASATGGAATGGKSATSTGGAATGGKSATSTGGTAAGGSGTGGAETGGAGTGGSGTGGTATGGSSSSPVTPTKVSASDYRFVVGDVTIDINPQVGGRVTKMTIGSTNIIQPYTCSSYDAASTCNNSAGSTFWTSPQSAWDGTPAGDNIWPPVAAIDGNAYTPEITDDHLVLTGSADTTLGASVTKDFSADAGTGWISITYTIKATKAIQVAPWQITRVPRGGLVFFPLVSLISNTTSWTLSPQGGYEWIDDKNQTSVSSSGPKVIADGGIAGQDETWLAYAVSGNLFLIRYPDVKTGSFAPNEADTEVYPGSGYMELEAQGEYESLSTGATSVWTVQWLVVPIPGSVTVAAGSAPLLEFVQEQLGS